MRDTVTRNEDQRARLWTSVPRGGQLLAGLGRSASYAAAARKELPVIRVGRRLVVSLPRLAETLGLPLRELLELENALPDEPDAA